MGHHLTIESDETVALATQLATLTGESLEQAVLKAVRAGLEAAQDRQAETQKALEAVEAFHDWLEHPRPASDHGWLYDDETGLPI